MDDFKKIARAKAYRGTLRLKHDDTLCRWLLHMVCSGPAEHLLMVLQNVDHAGSGMRDVGSPSCPFNACLAEYLKMLCNPLEHPGMQALFSQFEPEGAQYVRSIMLAAIGMILGIAACIWRELSCTYYGWPYKSRDLSSASERIRVACTDELFSFSECCVDTCVTLKIMHRCRTAARLLKDDYLLACIRTWTRRARFTNMHTERVFSLVCRASPSRSHVLRFLSAGFLSQIQSRHLIAGGADIRKITRSQLRSMDAPIRARGKKALVKTKRKTGREQMIGATWINARIALLKSHNPTGKLASRED